MNSTTQMSGLQTSLNELRRFEVAESQNLSAQDIAIEDENIPMIQSFEKSSRVDLHPMRAPRTPTSTTEEINDGKTPFINHTDDLPMPAKNNANNQAHISARCVAYSYHRTDGPDLQAVCNSLEAYTEYDHCKRTTNDDGTKDKIAIDTAWMHPSASSPDEKHSPTDEVTGAPLPQLPQTSTSISVMPVTQQLPQISNNGTGIIQRQTINIDSNSSSALTLKDAFTQTITGMKLVDCATQTDEIVPSDVGMTSLANMSSPAVSMKIRRSARLKKSASI